MRSLSDIISEACSLWDMPNRQGIRGHSDVGMTIACVAMDEARQRLTPIINAQKNRIKELEEEIKEIKKKP